MLFNSPAFALFFPIVTTLYFLSPQRARWSVLLFASAVFYMAFVPAYILILLFTILVDYAAGMLIESSQGRRRKAWLLASLVANIGVLAIFKYYGFIAKNLAWIGDAFNVGMAPPVLNILLPIGLSFHTFQALAYTIEVYRGRFPAERHLGYFALYILFFPQLVAGPIERPQNLLPQFRIEHHFDYARVVGGLQRIALGLFKKVVVADQLAVAVDVVYADPTRFQGLPLLLAVVFFAFQLYYDFSGYSDIAIGSAQVMGFTLMRNFRAPFSSSTFSEFWRRWHVSLSTWFRDYLYRPLVEDRKVGRSVALLLVFTVSGLWHGASWNFVAWGLLTGLMVLTGKLTRPARERAGFARNRQFGMCVTFLLFAGSLILFRSHDLIDARHVATHMHVGLLADVADLAAGKVISGLSRLGLFALLLLVGLQLWVDALDDRTDVFIRVARWPMAARFGLYFLLVYSCLGAASIRSPQQFVYFQF